MRDISFLEWFLLGMPVEWFVLTAVAGAALLLWVAASSWLDGWRRARDEREERAERPGRN